MTEEYDHQDGELYINGSWVNSNSLIKIEITNEGDLMDPFISFRTVFEGIGADVILREGTNDILIKYNDKIYLANTEYYNYVYDKLDNRLENHALYKIKREFYKDKSHWSRRWLFGNK